MKNNTVCKIKVMTISFAKTSSVLSKTQNFSSKVFFKS
jgi:hypothetical protein